MLRRTVQAFHVLTILAVLISQFGLLSIASMKVAAAPALETNAAFTVNSTVDAVDASIGNGLCETATAGECTLRAAIQETNALPGSNTITVPAGTYLLASNGQLQIADGVVINGADATTTIIDGAGLYRVFNIHTVSLPVQISSLTVRNGKVSDTGSNAEGEGVGGAGIRINNAFNVTLANMIFSANQGAPGGAIFQSGSEVWITQSVFTGNSGSIGGAIYLDKNSGSNILHIQASSFSNNQAPEAGAIYNAGTMDVSASSFTYNSATGSATSGGAFLNEGTISLVNSTVAYNTATGTGGGLINRRTAAISMLNSTLAYNTAALGGGNLHNSNSGSIALKNTIVEGDGCAGTIINQGNNLASGGACGNFSTGNAALGPLTGSPAYFPLVDGSAAIDAGTSNGAPAADIRGVSRPQGAGFEIGAFEYQPPDPHVFIVTNTNDGGPGSLRQAILDANLIPNRNTELDQIQFNITGSGVKTITPLSALPALTDAVVIDGYTQPGASVNTLVSGNNATILVELNGSACDSCDGLSITSNGSTVKGLSIYGGFDNAIHLNGGNGNTIVGNWIGSSASGTASGVTASGVSMANASNNVVGGTSPADRNVISNNGSGVGVSSGTGNIIQGNDVYSNINLGIDLAVDGITFNHQGFVSGPNNYQNYPVLYLATSDGNTTRLKGILVSDADQSFVIDVYSNTTCDATEFGEGHTYFGSFTVNTDANGFASFDKPLPGGATELLGISTTVTGANGTSEFSYCRPIATPNLNWVQAQAVTGASQTQQYITDRFQEKWFKFPVQPGSSVTVTLTSLPGSAVSLHRDPYIVYNALINPVNEVLLSAESSDVSFLPSGSLPSGSLPSGSLPSGSLPSGSLPSGSLPTGYLPSGSLPSGSLPSGSLPSGSLPSGSLPSGSLPSGSLPSGSLPSGSLPSGSLASETLPSGSLPSGSLPSGSLPSGSLPSGSLDAYALAARYSVMGISMNPYATVQTIERNTYDIEGDLYVRVVGPYDLQTPFTLDVTVQDGLCGAVQPVPNSLQVNSGPAFAPGSNKTIILTDTSRLDGTDTEKANALAKLDLLKARSDVVGDVVDLGDARFERVVFANQQADAHTACAFARNTVADEIKKVIDEYRQANPTLEYIVLAGGAEVIPFFQVQDVSGLANERDYVVPVAPSTSSEASLRSNLVQGQDGYGSQLDVTQAGYTLAYPDLAVGRLVGNASDIGAAVDAYIAVDGMITPDSSLVTGYDFVGDAAHVIAQELQAGTSSTPVTLIQDPGLPPSDPSAWTAEQLYTKLAANNYDIAVLSGHFSAGSLLAADYSSELSAAQIAGSPVDMSNVLVLALGCHGGYNIPERDQFEGLSPDPDWAKAFQRMGAAGYISATGYAYGDTELTEYGERLFILMAQQLRAGTGPVSIGEALMDAKRQYLSEMAQLSGIDQKTIVEMTLYGFPMMKVNMPGERISGGTGDPLSGTINSVSNGPGEGFGLTSRSVALPQIETEPVYKQLEDLSNPGSLVDVMYLTGRDGVIANPFEPLYPMELHNVTSTGKVLRGVAFRGGSYTDTPDIKPLTSSPTTETSTAHLSYYTDVFYPSQSWMTNYFDALNGGDTNLVVIPAQFRSDDVQTTGGTLRTFTAMDFQLYYLPGDWASGSATTMAAAVSAAPNILGVSAFENSNGTSVTFRVNAVTEGSAGVQAVWVLYTGRAGSANYYGKWTPLDLVQSTENPMLWEGALNLLPGESAQDLQFMVQAVGGAGLTSLATNLGAYYGVVTTGPQTATMLSLQSPSSGTYLKESTFDLLLETASGQPLQGQLVTLNIGGQQVFGITDSTGGVTLDLTPVVRPGNYVAQASFRGNSEYLASTASNAFTLYKDTTSLTVTPASATVFVGYASPFVAVVRDSEQRPLAGRSVFFIVHNGSDSYTKSVIADYRGNAALGNVPLPPGGYTVDAYFNGTIPVNGNPVTLIDDYYGSSNRLGSSLTIVGDTTPPTISASATKADGTPYTAGEWTNQTVTVHFTCDDIGIGIAACPPDQVFSTDGIFTAEGTATDRANNTSSASLGPIRIDKTAPTITATTITSPNAAGWYNSNVTVHFACVDSGSGSGIPEAACPADQILSAEGAAVSSAARTVTDAAGNTSASSNIVTVKIDKTAPTITAAATTSPNASGWYTGNVTVHFTCTDTGSGIPAGACPADQILSTNGTAVSSTAQTVSDLAGNTSAPSNIVTVKIDKAAPTLNPVVSPNPVLLNGTATVSLNATDADSGLQLQSCGILVTNSVGTKSVTCTAVDNAGNTVSRTVQYQVIYRFDGFLQPINDTGHTEVCGTPCPLSIFKGGSTVPVYFQLKDIHGNVVQSASLPIWVTPQRGSPMTAAIDESVYSLSASSGQYYTWFSSSQKYNYNWDTRRYASGYYWRIGVQLDDGQTYYVTIGLR